MVRFRQAHIFLRVKWGDPSRKEPWNPAAETSNPRAQGEPEGWAWPLRRFQAVKRRWWRPDEWCEAGASAYSLREATYTSYPLMLCHQKESVLLCLYSSLPPLEKSLIRIMKLPRPTLPTLTARAQNTACFWTRRLTQVTRTAELWKALVHRYKIVRWRGHILDFGIRQLLVQVSAALGKIPWVPWVYCKCLFHSVTEKNGKS